MRVNLALYQVDDLQGAAGWLEAATQAVANANNALSGDERARLVVEVLGLVLPALQELIAWAGLVQEVPGRWYYPHPPEH